MIEDLGGLLGDLAVSGPLGMIGVGLLFLISGLWLRRQYQPYMPQLSVAAGTAFACGGAALMVAGIIWASVKRVRQSATAISATLAKSRRPPDQGKPVPRDGQAFERLVAEFFRAQGYEVEETGTDGQGGDRGVDLVLRRPADPASPVILVQCKDYVQWGVGAERVRAFAGAIALRGPGHVGMIVTTGRFTADATRDAAALDIRLIDGGQWAEMAPLGVGSVSTIPSSPTASAPLCPSCRVPMVRRGPKTGEETWRPFWGCRNYPQCRERFETA
ncbi:MAG TPA: restriction endonuclease [Tepidisphaeraceae bacterium]